MGEGKEVYRRAVFGDSFAAPHQTQRIKKDYQALGDPPLPECPGDKAFYFGCGGPQCLPPSRGGGGELWGPKSTPARPQQAAGSFLLPQGPPSPSTHTFDRLIGIIVI